MRKLLIASAIFFLFFFYGLILSQKTINVLPERLEPTDPIGFYDYRGITNVHTSRSTGSGSPAEVIRAAQDASLDWLFITDVNDFARAELPEGYHRKTLVLKGAEYSYLDSRLLAYDLLGRHEIETLGQAQVLFADLLSQSGKDADQDLIILAHPGKPGFEWKGPYPSGLDGIEVLNLKSIWLQAFTQSKISFLWSLFVYPFNSQLALLRLYDEPRSEISLWDQLSTERKTIGMAGADATARTSSFGGVPLRFPSYQRSFSLLSNHVLLPSELTGKAESDKRKILSALAEGQFYMSLDVLGNPKGFVASIQDDEKIYPMGSRLKWKPGMKMIVHLPRKPKTPFEAAFFKDGQHVMSSNSSETEYEIQGPGVYRVTVRVFLALTLPDGQRWFTWIYSNPFFIE